MRTKTPSKKTLTEQASDLVEQVSPHVEAARDKVVNDYLPVAQSVLADARETAKEMAQDATAAAQAAAADLEKSTRKSRKQAAKKTKEKARKAAAAAAATPAAVAVANKVKPESSKPKRKKWVLLLIALGGAGVVAAKRMGGRTPATPAYAPPRPVSNPVSPVSTTPPPAPPAPPTAHFEPGTADPAGASPGEALADATEVPEGVTTPDQPAEVEDLSAKNPRS
jgi:hypothetical protein